MHNRQSGHNLLDYLLVLTIFLSGFYVFTPLGVFYFSYFLFFVYIAVRSLQNKAYVSRYAYFLFLGFIAHALAIIWLNDLLVAFPKILFSSILFSVMLFAYYTLIRRYLSRLDQLYKMYLDVAVLVSIFTLLQELLLLAGIPKGFLTVNGIVKDMGGWWGVPGLSAEPAELAIVLMPALYYSAVQITNKKGSLWQCLVIFVAIALSSSSLGIIGLLLCFIFILQGKLKGNAVLYILIVPVFLFLIWMLVNQDYFLIRVQDSMELFLGGAFVIPEGYNLSSYSQVVNYDMVVRSINDFNFLGAGFSNYQGVYNFYINDYHIPLHRDDIPGSGTATSLLLRIVGEFGVVGMVALLAFFKVFGFYPKSNDIRIACYIFILLAFLRMGIYFANGTVFFFLLYALSAVEYERPKPTKIYSS